MNAWILAGKYSEKNPEGHFFDKKTLKFFGERFSDMYVLKETRKIKDWSGNEHECYVLSSLQRNHPLGPRRHYSYFDTTTFEFIAR